jgi:riboflavin biosynthesis pyrimidine reductase
LDKLTRIFPPAAGSPTLDPRTAYGELEFAALAPPGRPYTIVNMVATVDGQGRVGANTATLGDAADAALFATLRERVDCVMAGARTIEIEQYNAPARSGEVQQRRVEAGLAPRPLVATVTRSGRLPLGAPLFADPGLRVLAFGGDDPGEAVAAQVGCPPEVEPAAVLKLLRTQHGVRSLLLEGGPKLNTAFFAEELVDELFLTIAPSLVGGDGQFPIIAGSLPVPQRLHLIGALAGDEHLFLRYRVD